MFNWQVHQAFLTGAQQAVPGQRSTYKKLMQMPEDIVIFHYSSDKPPSKLLQQMKFDDDWDTWHEWHEDVLAEWGGRMNYLDHSDSELAAMKQVVEIAHTLWLDTWKLCYEHILEYIYKVASEETHTELFSPC